ncbi:hypothetical protein GCM10007859_12590 [Brevundimonas denitrificans]|uniref:Secreted protein n=1 Tax=Brevundimonas denitrificans TaxID=1443434 RepID=A0ABQ6BMY4_9CAUL|nr:hypothetical protein [Brevundimonas denitrificans]GLS01248.1 hypothetical protein GCM10007859_12590 [Brevundimonas denitrificans]
MFRLKATLVAMTLMRPWRTGWSEDRGVDFSLAAAVRPTPAPPGARDETPAAEPACFIDEDWAAPPSAAVVRSFVSLAAAEAAIEPPPEDAADTAGMRAWWSLSGKPSRT